MSAWEGETLIVVYKEISWIPVVQDPFLALSKLEPQTLLFPVSCIVDPCSFSADFFNYFYL